MENILRYLHIVIIVSSDIVFFFQIERNVPVHKSITTRYNIPQIFINIKKTKRILCQFLWNIFSLLSIDGYVFIMINNNNYTIYTVWRMNWFSNEWKTILNSFKMSSIHSQTVFANSTRYKTLNGGRRIFFFQFRWLF